MQAVDVREVSLQNLRDAAPAGEARDATGADAIDGLRPRFVVEPETVQEISEVLKLAAGAHWAVAPRGAGTKLGWGNPPKRLDLILSTARLNRVLEHSSGDLVVSAQAGVPLRHLQEVLVEAGQRLALDPPDRSATLGGIIASNDFGPLRLRYGTVRDLLIGITYVLPDGTIAKAGGKVVKNVAGYDLCKLFSGSLGTLGVVAEAIFRVHPRPAVRKVVSCTMTRIDSMGRAVRAILESQMVPSSVEVAWDGGHIVVACSFEGLEAGVEAQARETVKLLGPYGSAHILESTEESVLWDRMTALPWQGQGRVGFKLSCPIADLPDCMQEVIAESGARGIDARMVGHAGNGVLLVGLFSRDEERLVESIEVSRRRAAEHGGHVAVLHASPTIKTTLDVWGPAGDAVSMMRRVKQQFDPLNTLNPGRFVGAI